MLKRSSASNKTFLKKLSLLVNSGLPLSKALDLACGPADPCGISGQVKSGVSLGSALMAAGFPPMAAGIVSVAEKSGNLPSGLAKAAEYLDKQSSFRRKMIGALAYPAFVIGLSAVSVLAFSIFLLPLFSSIYVGLGMRLPLLSRLLLKSVKFLPLAVAAAVISSYFMGKYLLSDRGIGFPVIGAFRKRVALAGFYSSMSQSLSAGLNIVESHEISADSVASGLIRAKLREALRSVSEGDPLNRSLERTGLFDATAISLIEAGESSSSLGNVFAQLAGAAEEEIEVSVKTVSSLVEPVSTLAVGLVVAIIVLGMFMPIIKLVEAFGG